MMDNSSLTLKEKNTSEMQTKSWRQRQLTAWWSRKTEAQVFIQELGAFHYFKLVDDSLSIHSLAVFANEMGYTHVLG